MEGGEYPALGRLKPWPIEPPMIVISSSAGDEFVERLYRQCERDAAPTGADDVLVLPLPGDCRWVSVGEFAD
jgi:hypothetical protein